MTLKELEASIERCRKYRDLSWRDVNMARKAILACLVVIVVMSVLGLPGSALIPEGLAILLWFVERHALQEAIEWGFWLGRSQATLDLHLLMKQKQLQLHDPFTF